MAGNVTAKGRLPSFSKPAEGRHHTRIQMTRKGSEKAPKDWRTEGRVGGVGGQVGMNV